MLSKKKKMNVGQATVITCNSGFYSILHKIMFCPIHVYGCSNINSV